MSRVIGVVSGKGGVGKTVITVNLTAALMSLDESVIAVDSDLRMSGLGLQLGMYHFPVTLNDIILRDSSILEALYIHSSGLRIIPASLYIHDVNVNRLGRLLSDPALEDETILVDSPPGLDRNSLAVLKACREAIVVTTAEIPALADVMKTIKAAEKNRCEVLGIVVNRYRRGFREQLRPKEIEQGCGFPVIGMIPEDRNITKSLFRRSPSVFLSPYSRSSMEFKRVACSMCNKSYRDRNVFLKRLLWRFKR